MTVLDPPQPGDSRNVINYQDYLREFKPKKRVKHKEYDICKALVVKLNWLIARGKLNGFYTCFPAGHGKLTAAQGGRLKAAGLLAGVSDYIFFALGTAFFLEMKAGANQQNDNQETFQKLAEAGGYPYAVCWSVDEALETLTGWGVLSA